MFKSLVDASEPDIGNHIHLLKMFHHDFPQNPALDLSVSTGHQICFDLTSERSHLIVADPRVSASGSDAIDELVLLEIFICAVPLFHLHDQIDRLKRREAAHALAAFSPPSDRIDLHCVPRVGDLQIFMVTKRASHNNFRPSLAYLGRLEIFVNIYFNRSLRLLKPTI